MSEIDFSIVQHDDQQTQRLISDWYFSEWQIPIETTMKRLQAITGDQNQFQVLLTLNGTPVSTGGIYDHVGLLDKEPDLKVHKKWLALVYTIPEERQRGYGAAICNYIAERSKILGFNKIHLFTDTAASLYQRLGWVQIQCFTINSRNIVVMEKLIV